MVIARGEREIGEEMVWNEDLTWGDEHTTLCIDDVL